ncbi:MAG: T9SS type A sorting domain-containing protein, partial [Flavobacteriaceae bacterium]|nr:T9SS type A sorting domain-containing protein [Flavobacteriaceae bacterium]
MKIFTYILLFLTGLSAYAQVTTSPTVPLADGEVIIYLDKSGTGLDSYTGTIYAHIGVTVDGNRWQNVIGTWGDNSTQPSLTSESGTTYSLTLSPNLYTYFGVNTNSTISGINVVFRSADATQQTSPDIFISVGTVDPPPTVVEAPVPTGMLDGINYNTSDNTKVTLVLYAPGKDYVNVIGDFNNWQRDDTNYLLKKDSSKDRFWIELTGLTPQTNHMYQYLVNGTLRIADPYSTSILDENNDQYIDNATYPNLPAYPTGQTSHAVTLLRTGDAAYNWQVTNFQRPAKTDLVIYELLIRDFDALHSFNAVKARLDYLQTLGVNAIELMPVSEFDGNESWGYNPSFHMALDKYYGTPTAFKQFIDECHSRGIAVILDVVYNHATGQNPFYRMWNTDNGGYNGQASTDSPFFNPVATHTYSVFNDFNHSKQATQDYVKRTTQYWINEYKIDGFRWDLTKGFTQNCTDDPNNDNGCTGNYQADRVAVLKEYADYQWDVDPNFYIIFEHLGTNTEETEWINYRLNEGKGIMVWGNHNYNYNEATMGWNDDSDFSWISYLNRGWSVPANVSYMESHDEERLMYKNLQHGNSSGTYDIQTLSTALDRMELAGAFYFTVPGPKMIWQFGELGYDYSIDYDCRVCNKPIRWDYFNDPDRKALYDKWSKLIQLKKQEDIFRTANFTLDVANSNGLKKIQLTDPAANPDLKYVTIIGNFGVTTQSINPTFQQTGTWYDLLNNNASITVTNTNSLISLQPGEFKIYGSGQVTLAIDEEFLSRFSIYPNPVEESFRISVPTNEVAIYDISGRLIKSFKGTFIENKDFDISNLKSSIYLVKITSDEGS